MTSQWVEENTQENLIFPVKYKSDLGKRVESNQMALFNLRWTHPAAEGSPEPD